MNGFYVLEKDGSEPNLERIIRTEEWCENLQWYAPEAFAITEYGQLVLLDGCGNMAYCPPKRFTVKYV